MRDITKNIKNAIAQDVPWGIDLFFSAIELLKENNYQLSYWENEENWAILIIKNEPIGYMWKKYPLIIILNNHLINIKVTLTMYQFLNYIGVDDLDEEGFTLDYSLLTDYLEYGVNYDKFSASDLWFYTNSI